MRTRTDLCLTIRVGAEAHTHSTSNAYFAPSPVLTPSLAPSPYTSLGRKPVVNVTWLDAIQYCNYRSRLEGLPEAYTDDGRLIPIDWVKGISPS